MTIKAVNKKKEVTATQRIALTISVLLPCGCLLKVIEIGPWSGGLFFILYMPLLFYLPGTRSCTSFLVHPLKFVLKSVYLIPKNTLLDNTMNTIIIRPANALVLELADRHA